jgi:pilus assembly protein CpaF
VNHGFSVNDLIYRANKLRSDSDESMQAQDYSEILDKLQRIIAKNHSAELAQVLYSEEAEEKLKDLIMRYLNSEQLVAKDKGNISELVDAIYYDMAGMGLLSPYLQDTDTEEINVNGYGGIWVLYRDRKVRLNETFGTPEACSNIVRKMECNPPIAWSYIGLAVHFRSGKKFQPQG